MGVRTCLHVRSERANLGDLGYSPDLNPQENVWSWAEERLREIEKDTDTFNDFQAKVLRSCQEYPHGKKLIGGMSKRMKLLLEKGGANIGK